MFQPSLLDWLFGSGIGTNLGAAAVGLAIGYLWARAKFRAVHAHVAIVHASSQAVHEKLDAHAKLHEANARAIEALHQRVTGDSRGRGPDHPR